MPREPDYEARHSAGDCCVNKTAPAAKNSQSEPLQELPSPFKPIRGDTDDPPES